MKDWRVMSAEMNGVEIWLLSREQQQTNQIAVEMYRLQADKLMSDDVAAHEAAEMTLKRHLYFPQLPTWPKISDSGVGIPAARINRRRALSRQTWISQILNLGSRCLEPLVILRDDFFTGRRRDTGANIDGELGKDSWHKKFEQRRHLKFVMTWPPLHFTTEGVGSC